MIGVDPGPKAQITTVRAVYSSIANGIQRLSQGAIEDAHFSDAAIRHLKTLSEIESENKKRPVGLKLWVQKSPTSLGHDVSRAISEDWRANYKDFGSLEGRLEVIRYRRKLEIRIRDQVLQQSISCNIPQDMLKYAFDSFRRRVEVFGVIHYRKSGVPISIEVQSIEQMPDDNDLPTLDDVRGILSGPV